ncbi:hypothetical protein AQUCO_04200004v1 [Aquilegia coerulea]|uniref:Uncharacterized protein n=1 Tax=Aquilegia coerulea TaxID=218851 RepID=A0A2G5CNS5_AQUCA|nr:hypothetical protein AQUCO_04200004v1 [Aquilegia coerulea]
MLCHEKEDVLERYNLTDVPSCPTQPNSRETYNGIMMDDMSSVNVTISKKKESEAAGTKRCKKKRSHGAAAERRQENVVIEFPLISSSAKLK